MRRIKTLLKNLSSKRIDACLFSKAENIYYLSGLQFEGYLLISPKETVVISDRRYKEDLQSRGKDFRFVWCNNYFGALKKELKRLKVRRLGFEDRHLSFREYQIFKGFVGELEGVQDSVEDMRSVKTESEIKSIKKSLKIASEAFSFFEEILSVGRSEKNLEAELIRFSIFKGAEGPSFPPIILSGVRTSLVHGRPSRRNILWNEPVLLDFGVKYKGYCSDLTRIFWLGRIPRYFKDIFKLLLDAQDIAFRTIRAGIVCSHVEKRVRNFLKRHGKERFFYHCLGHGVGLEVHEEPYLSLNSQKILKEGMVLTVEPGLYFEGKFGIRIEDMVVVRRNKAEVLSDYIHKSI